MAIERQEELEGVNIVDLMANHNENGQDDQVSARIDQPVTNNEQSVMFIKSVSDRPSSCTAKCTIILRASSI